MPARKCDNCGSTDIEEDGTRADAVCTGCGTVLESAIVVSEVQFAENAGGGLSAVGTFVSSERKGGGGTNFGGTFTSGIGSESREITLKNARKKINALAQQLRLRCDHVDIAFYFYKLSLTKHLTRGRKSSHVIAACVYITCRTEGTSHMLIDFSDVLQVGVYELGRTYLRLSQALCINIPAMDPCLYVMRFAHKLQLGDKTHQVSMTALRLVSRMKRDWIHVGRRPSGLCGAALLISSRLHDFSRSLTDIVTIVKLHESTVRKRLNEFGETFVSDLTISEFMTADLEAMEYEQDPPSFTRARLEDKKRLNLMELETNIDGAISRLEEKIERGLKRWRDRTEELDGDKLGDSDTEGEEKYGTVSESESDSWDKNIEKFIQEETGWDENIDKFIQAETQGVIEQCLDGETKVVENLEERKEVKTLSQVGMDSLLMPPPEFAAKRVSALPCSPGLGLKDTVEEYLAPTHSHTDKESQKEATEELDLTGIDEDEIDLYILTEKEVRWKTAMWQKVNKEYLEEQEVKAKREEEEREELIRQGIDPDKKKKIYKKKCNLRHNGTALEAIEKLVQEKKISTKINYDALKNLNFSRGDSSVAATEKMDEMTTSAPIKFEKKEAVKEGKQTIFLSQRMEKFSKVGTASKRPRLSQSPNLMSRKFSPIKDIKQGLETKVHNVLGEREALVEEGPLLFSEGIFYLSS